MSMHRKTITLTKQQDDWVKGQIESGHFGNDSEYIRHVIRRDQQAQERLVTLRRALAEGESSGRSKPLDLAAVKAAGRRRVKAPN
ncbi:type II toxin-antitoxin system ParD family antitoxin [Wenzhouxiangella sp. XN24]|uniref:type II toxin-antitoxin system ParD family antitoxin n=1 Tax=Wenzhouxiangella sp. XN24 TaxID=2713569 RepID=UPI0013EA1BDB|nr:type II toxin-antitoxin system ParD family antitoxin [Wenzhouxiangella sp. XN24]NGX17693.1 type II toxin-antitoxin system ParD family antitoxin [Wenzhouxiangella sp. XN24]